ncbi:hypothetical protein IQ37_11445 [Chryseobacterium piperi]|uniref:Quinol oxidase subunit 4 n=2 Tax=Chryseobacterium piperi TaxID=558152 RepID=A0A086BCJ6_9FLAO|nr:hypothetical protein [Chryseobacterium piperi]ASW73415.1 hypothetical protein CJF12_03305 [Chryseobacterium piperi]KFF26660.1 hypothetical protein IQ37_11445 [Chryseobacterium piperi]
MKGLIKIVGAVSIVFMLASCTVQERHYHGRKGMPPGQAKKVYGGSARYYAPGQVKKRTYYYEYDDRGHKDKKRKKHYRD